MVDQTVKAPFASLIRDRRIAMGMTQEELAREVGCPQQTIEKIEKGKTRKSSYFPVIFSKLGLDLGLLTGAASLRLEPAAPRKFLKTSAFKFYIGKWREFMGVPVVDAARAVGLPADEYQAHETYPINFTLGQVAALADEFGVRGDQFWFPPPRTHRNLQAPAVRKKVAKK